jgi:DNA-directed RNA polymerase subunit RPC12/RpoP
MPSPNPPIRVVQCPKCGSPVQGVSAGDIASCSYCGALLLVSVGPSGHPMAQLANIENGTTAYLARTEALRHRRLSTPLLITLGVLLSFSAGLVLLSMAVEDSGDLSSTPPATPTRIVASATPTLTAEEILDLCRHVPYDQLARNTENYVGQIVQYEAKVIQVVEHGGGFYTLLVNVTPGAYGVWQDTMYVNLLGERFLEGDGIFLWGRVKGRKTYTTVLGQQVTVPEIDALMFSY